MAEVLHAARRARRAVAALCASKDPPCEFSLRQPQEVSREGGSVPTPEARPCPERACSIEPAFSGPANPSASRQPRPGPVSLSQKTPSPGRPCPTASAAPLGAADFPSGTHSPSSSSDGCPSVLLKTAPSPPQARRQYRNIQVRKIPRSLSGECAGTPPPLLGFRGVPHRSPTSAASLDLGGSWIDVSDSALKNPHSGPSSEPSRDFGPVEISRSLTTPRMPRGPSLDSWTRGSHRRHVAGRGGSSPQLTRTVSTAKSLTSLVIPTKRSSGAGSSRAGPHPRHPHAQQHQQPMQEEKLPARTATVACPKEIKMTFTEAPHRPQRPQKLHHSISMPVAGDPGRPPAGPKKLLLAEPGGPRTTGLRCKPTWAQLESSRQSLAASVLLNLEGEEEDLATVLHTELPSLVTDGKHQAAAAGPPEDAYGSSPHADTPHRGYLHMVHSVQQERTAALAHKLSEATLKADHRATARSFVGLEEDIPFRGDEDDAVNRGKWKGGLSRSDSLPVRSAAATNRRAKLQGPSSSHKEVRTGGTSSTDPFFPDRSVGDSPEIVKMAKLNLRIDIPPLSPQQQPMGPTLVDFSPHHATCLPIARVLKLPKLQ